MRTTAGSALVLLIAGACAAPAPAATLRAPGSAAPREVLAVTVDGLAPGRWAVFLTRDDFAGRPCYARLARRTARAGRPTVFSGRLPATVRCPQEGIPGEGAAIPPPPPAPPVPEEPPAPTQPAPTPPGGPEPVEPGGGHRLVVCVPDGRECGEVPVDRNPLRIVPAGTPCGTVVFTPASDHGAFSLRARNVTCAAARRVARGAEGGDRRFRRAGLRCHGTFDGAGLPRTVYRCTRPGARVTFTAG